MIARLVLAAVFVAFFILFACNLHDAGTEPAAPRIHAPDTCRPPACYPDPRPPAPPK